MSALCARFSALLGSERATFVSLAVYFLALSIPLFSSMNEDKSKATWGAAWTGQAVFEMVACLFAWFSAYKSFKAGQRAIIAPLNFCFGCFCLGNSIINFGKANIHEKCSEAAQYAFHSMRDESTSKEYDENTFTACGVFITLGCLAVVICLILNFLSCSNFDVGTKHEENFRGLVCLDMTICWLFMAIASIYFFEGGQVSSYNPQTDPATQGYGAAGFFSLLATLFAAGAVYYFKKTADDKFYYLFFISLFLFCLGSSSIFFAYLDNYRRLDPGDKFDFSDVNLTHGFAGIIVFLSGMVNVIAIFNAVCKNNPNYKAGLFLTSWTTFTLYYATMLWSMCKIFQTCKDGICTIDQGWNRQSSGFQAVMLLTSSILQLAAATCSRPGDDGRLALKPNESYGRQNDI
jgi:hypothetical protein